MTGNGPPRNLMAVGVIRRPHGVRGEASVESWTDSLDRFTELREVTLVSPDNSDWRAATIESVRLHAGRGLVKFAGIEAPEQMATLRGWSIEIPEGEARKPGKDEYFLHDLVGLGLVDESGTNRGTVVDAFEGGSGVLLTVEHQGKRFDLPFASAICKRIDLESKSMLVELPDGIDEV